MDSTAALVHFSVADPILHRIATGIQNSGKPLILPIKKPADTYARSLYSSIISQQISVKAAEAIYKRFIGLVGDEHDGESILSHTVDEYRAIGLSRQKASYIMSIAEHTQNGTVRFEHLDTLDDEAVIAELTQIKGVGRWTAEMFLLFTLARPDIFSAGDLGLLTAMRRLYDKPDLSREEASRLAERWSPHRSIASLVLWHSLDNKPVAS